MSGTINGQSSVTISHSSSHTADGTSGTTHWTCSICGQRIPFGEMHICPGRKGDFTGSWPPKPDYSGGYPYTDSVTATNGSLNERQVRALERIADALEKLAKRR